MLTFTQEDGVDLAKIYHAQLCIEHRNPPHGWAGNTPWLAETDAQQQLELATASIAKRHDVDLTEVQDALEARDAAAIAAA